MYCMIVILNCMTTQKKRELEGSCWCCVSFVVVVVVVVVAVVCMFVVVMDVVADQFLLRGSGLEPCGLWI